MVAPFLLLSFYTGLPLKIAAALAIPLLRWSTLISKKITITLIAFFPIYILLIQISRFYSGVQGIDFAIFAQSLHNFSHLGRLETSLIDYRPHNFLTHHLSPYLYLIGAINQLVDNAPVLLIVLHSISTSISLFLIYKLFSFFHKDKWIVLLLISLSILLPSSRLGLTWEVRDEIFAFPIIIYAYLSYFKKLHIACALSLVSLSLFKENLMLFSIFFSVMALFQCNTRKPYILVIAFSLITFILYTRVLPNFLFLSTFDFTTRIGRINDIFTYEKLKWLFIYLTPFAPFLILKPRRLISSFIPLIPLVGAIIISNFAPMANPYNYYSFLPSQLLLLTLVSLVQSPKHWFYLSL